MKKSELSKNSKKFHSFFEQFYQEGGWSLDEFSREVYWQRVKKSCELINSLGTGLTILDLGCGKGQVSRFISRENEVYGLDISAIALKDALYFSDGVVAGDAQRIPFKDNMFDLVLFIESIYYFDEPSVVLKEIGRVLKPKGYLLLECGVSNAPHLWWTLILRGILGRKMEISTDCAQTWVTARYSTFGLKKMLTQNDFVVEEKIPFFFKLPMIKDRKYIQFMIKLGEIYPFFAMYNIFLARNEKEK